MADEKYYNAAGTHVLVYNPNTEARWESPEDYLSVALARGWELAEPEAEILSDEEADGFDPSLHKVTEVNTYLADADPDEVARVLQLEADGENRKSVRAPDPVETNDGE